jgi:hypothetical protein
MDTINEILIKVQRYNENLYTEQITEDEMYFIARNEWLRYVCSWFYGEEVYTKYDNAWGFMDDISKRMKEDNLICVVRYHENKHQIYKNDILISEFDNLTFEIKHYIEPEIIEFLERHSAICHIELIEPLNTLGKELASNFTKELEDIYWENYISDAVNLGESIKSLDNKQIKKFLFELWYLYKTGKRYNRDMFFL